MKKETYLALTNSLRQRPTLARIITRINTIITYSIYCAYPCLLVWLFLQITFTAPFEEWLHSTFVAALIVPLVSFVLLSLLRSQINAPRPYEVFNVEPVIPKDTRGNSFPSRHVFSIFVIGTTSLAVTPTPALGTIILVMGVLLAVVRVWSGVHFPRDVIAGALLGIAAGSITFALL